MEDSIPLSSKSDLNGVGPNSRPSSSSSASQNGAVALEEISPTVYYLRSTRRATRSSPSAIIIFAWMGAPIRHMSKFVEHYSQTMFPGSPIILVLSPANQFMAKDEERKKELQPAYTTFQSLAVNPNTTLVHLFSNGGVTALRTFVSLTPTNSFTPRELVLDSAPGTASFGGAVAAFTADIRSPIVRFLTSLFVGTLYIGLVLKELLFGQEPVLNKLTRWLGEGKSIGKEARLVYLYSDADALVQRSSVEANIRHMKDSGYTVTSRNFGATRHVGHMRANPELYWSEILGAWKE
jgi:hypothetical protein